MGEPGWVRRVFGSFVMWVITPFLFIGVGLAAGNRWMNRRVWGIRGRATQLSWIVNIPAIVLVAVILERISRWFERDDFKTLGGLVLVAVLIGVSILGAIRWLLQRLDRENRDSHGTKS